jgi:DNA-binding response OmpR family regulator
MKESLMTHSGMLESQPGVTGAQSSVNSGLRILVVEDDPDTALSQTILLRLTGHDVEVADDGPSALAKALVYLPDVILLDIGLPDFNGWEIAKLLREHWTKPAFIIAITGHGREVDKRQSAAAGIDLHLTKPVDQGYLEIVLRRFQKVIN